MATFTEKAKRLDRIRRDLAQALGPVQRQPVYDPVEHVLRAVLGEEATEAEVEAALQRMRDHFVDWNDLRVSRPREIREVLGETFPLAGPKARVIPRLLDQVFKRHNTMRWEFLREMGKVEVRRLFEGLEEVRPFVAATMARDLAGAHAFPVDRDVARVLGRLGLVDPQTQSEAQMQAFLERAVKAADAPTLHAQVKRLAEAVCRPEAPDCPACPLRQTCPTAAARARAQAEARRQAAARKQEKKKAAAKKAARPKRAAKKKSRAVASAGSPKKKTAKKKTSKRTTKAVKKKTARRRRR